MFRATLNKLSLETLKKEYVYLMKIFKNAAINKRSLENARLYISNKFTSSKEYIDAIKFILMKMVTDQKIDIITKLARDLIENRQMSRLSQLSGDGKLTYLKKSE